MNALESSFELVGDAAAAPVLGTGYSVAQVLVGGVVLIGGAALLYKGTRKLVSGIMG